MPATKPSAELTSFPGVVSPVNGTTCRGRLSPPTMSLPVLFPSSPLVMNTAVLGEHGMLATIIVPQTATAAAAAVAGKGEGRPSSCVSYLPHSRNDLRSCMRNSELTRQWMINNLGTIGTDCPSPLLLQRDAPSPSSSPKLDGSSSCNIANSGGGVVAVDGKQPNTVKAYESKRYFRLRRRCVPRPIATRRSNSSTKTGVLSREEKLLMMTKKKARLARMKRHQLYQEVLSAKYHNHCHGGVVFRR